MNHKSPADFREQLIYQLIVLGDDKSLFLDNHAPAHGNKRNQLDSFLSKYVQAVELLLSKTDDQLSSVVLIGSHVTITYLSDQEQEQFTIVLPDQSDPNNHHISFLSPLANQLLLKHPDTILSIDTPMGDTQIKIDKISLPIDPIPINRHGFYGE